MMRIRRLMTLVAAPLLAGALLGFGSGTARAATCLGWTDGQPSSPNALVGVAVVSVCDVWAVGSDSHQTVIEHWTGGSTWTQVPSPNPGPANTLTSVTAVSPSNIWAVGAQNPLSDSVQPLIVHWDGTSWNLVPVPTLSDGGSLSAVSAVSANDIWAVGRTPALRTVILHWDGTSWTRTPSPNLGTGFNVLTGVGGRTASNAWAVGDYADGSVTRTLILHWNGSTWTQVHSADPSATVNFLNAVTAVSGNDAWAVGGYTDSAGLDHALAEHWDGSTWTPVDTPPAALPTRLAGVTATSASNAWAVGTSVGAGNLHGPVALHWDGTSWSTVPTLPAQPDNLLFAVAASSPSNVWAVGGQAAGSFAAPLQGDPEFLAAANMRGGTLYEAGFVNGATSQSIAAGTSPAVAMAGGITFKIAWTGANGHLLLIDQAGQRTDTGKTVAAGTNPAIATLSGGGFQAVFVNAADGQLWQVTPAGAVTRIGPGYTPAPGTSPAIAADGSGGYQIAVHGANTDDLWTISPDGSGRDTGLKVAASTSPAITTLPGGYAIAFVDAASGLLWQVTPIGSRQVGPGYTPAPGTSPAIAADPVGGYQIAVHGANTDDLWTIGTDGSGRDTGLKLAAGTSPAAASRDGALVLAFSAAGTSDLTTIDTGGFASDTGVVLAAGTSPSIADSGPFVSSRTPVPSVVGDRQADAEDAVIAAGLTIGSEPLDNTCKDFAGAVVGQEPGAGQIVSTGSPVTLTISSGMDGHGKKCIIT